jgi:acetylornithine deacetylase/succinyl-diaminopimelate desuccinylase-like protein
MRESLVMVMLAAAVTSLTQGSREPDWNHLEQETLQHFQALLRLDTSSPPGHEHLATDYLKGVFERAGIAVQVFASDQDRPNLVARITGSGRKRPLLLMGHTDVVTVDPKKWSFPPFGAVRDGGYVYGRGSRDDRPHIVAGLMTLLELKRLGLALDRDIIFVAESGEEGTTSVGIDFMVKEHLDQIDAEYCLAEGGQTSRNGGRLQFFGVELIEKVPRSVDLVAHGTSGHGSIPLEDNPVVHLSRAVAVLAAWRTPIRLNDTTRAYFTRLAELSPREEADRYRRVLESTTQAARTADEYFLAHEPRHASMLRTSISPTIISGGYRVNVIPSEARATLDVRMLPDEDPTRFLDEVRKRINDTSVDASYTAVTSPRPSGRAARLDTEAFRAIEAAVARQYQVPTLPLLQTAATDMSQMRAKATECYGISPAEDAEDGPKGFGAHSDQERILERDLYRFVRLEWDVVIALAAAR